MRAITTTLIFFIFLTLGLNIATAQSDPFGNNITASESVNSLIKSETPNEAAVITAIQMKELQKKDPMLAILDIRDKEAYEAAKIQRAKHVGVEFTQEKIWMLNRNSNIVIYGDDVEQNEAMCKLVLEKGFVNVFYLNGTLTDLEIQGIEVVGDVVKSDKIAAKKVKKK